MPRSFVLILVVLVIVAVAIFALSRIDPTKAPQRMEKIVSENALAK